MDIKNILRNGLTRLKYPLYFQRMAQVGKNVIFGRNGCIIRPEEVYLGDHVFIAANFHLSARNLHIGNYVMIGPNVVIECDDHIFHCIGRRMYEVRDERTVSGINIEDDVWIGANVTILKGVTIGEGCVIGAGSVVTKSIPPYCVAFGNPCKVYRQRFDMVDLEKHLKDVRSKYTMTNIKAMW
ncbi:acyltransferase [Anaerohalosphaera lusitana]|uniref:acyltransferase n=1 Tax=Anaerohalosphaera lusitana TaxID=1936003 RepID=UPI00197B6BB4|nr:acyltransferase [Anaerohalosphaera lusitana]